MVDVIKLLSFSFLIFTIRYPCSVQFRCVGNMAGYCMCGHLFACTALLCVHITRHLTLVISFFPCLRNRFRWMAYHSAAIKQSSAHQFGFCNFQLLRLGNYIKLRPHFLKMISILLSIASQVDGFKCRFLIIGTLNKMIIVSVHILLNVMRPS